MDEMITSKQRAALRAMANTMQPLYQIGKEGVTPAVTAQLNDALEARELFCRRRIDLGHIGSPRYSSCPKGVWQVA